MFIARRVRERWRTLNRLTGKARVRLQEARGARGKLREFRWILRKAKDRFARLLKIALAPRPVLHSPHARQIALASQRTAISRMFIDSSAGPTCVPIGSGALALSLPAGGHGVVSLHLRDKFANLHSAKIIDSHAIGENGGEVRLVVQIPREFVDAKWATADVVLRTGNEQVVFADVPLGNEPSFLLREFQFENSIVSFAGECLGESPATITLGVFVDDDLSASCTLIPGRGTFAGALSVDHAHLDGRPHLLELRELPGMSVLASFYRLLPLHLTPWNALQTYARPPLDGSLSPQARHYLRSYQQWFARLRARGMDGIPPLDELFAELSQGFRKRHTYPKIAFAQPAHPTVSIVIPAHNKCEITYLCLCSLLFAFNETPFEIIIVDDGSSDETTRLSDFVEGISILRHDRAQGFVRACNDGAARARGEFVVMLNNDTQVTARWLDELVAVFRNFDRVGLAGSKLVYPDGRLQEAGGVIWGSGNPWNVGRDGNPDDPRYNYLRKVDYVSGAALMMRRELWNEVEGFGEEFAPGYFEDTDLAMKVRQTGRFVVYVPTSTVYHFEGQSAGTNVSAGMKSFQEVNRPKFRKKWSHVYRNYGREGEALDHEKDRDAAFRVLFIEHQFPFVDIDAGSYAAFQEMRLFQSMGAKVTFLPRNLAWMDRHALALQRIGVECLYAPYVMSFPEYVRRHASEYDLVYVTRYKIAEQVLPLVRAASTGTKVVFNLADLHFLREQREATAKTPGYSREMSEATRRAELAVVTASDLTFSYSDFEIAMLETLVGKRARLARMPWVVDCRKRATPFPETRDILFIGGFGHHPNAQAAKFFAGEVMPLLREHLSEAMFDVVGSGARTIVPELRSDCVRILGYVPDLAEHLDRARVFVAPLLAGAGLKGKVLDAISHGVPCVLSPIAAEGTGLTDGLDCLIADSKEAWAGCVAKLYTDEELWHRIGANALKLAETRYSFAQGTLAFENALLRVGISARRNWGLAYRHARPERYGL